MEIIEVNGKSGVYYEVINLSNDEVLFTGSRDECENYMYSIFLKMNGI